MSSPTTDSVEPAGGAGPAGDARRTGSPPAESTPPRAGRPLLVGIAGGSGSGKTTVVREVVRLLGADRVCVIQHDAYYRDLGDVPFDERVGVNFDHPDSLETELLARHLAELLAGRDVEVPRYDFTNHTRREDRRLVSPTPVLLLDGILVLASNRLRALMDLAVFVQADADARLARRLERDTVARGRSPESVVEQFRLTVQPMHERFVEPSQRYADVTIVGGGHNRSAISELVGRVEAMLERPDGPGQPGGPDRTDGPPANA